MTTSRARTSLLATISSLLFVACGPGAVAQEDFVAELSKATCEKLSECCSAAAEPFDEDFCLVVMADDLALGDLTNFEYDADQAGKCVDDVKNGECSEGPAVPESCSTVTRGTLPDGAECTSSDECAVPPGGFAYCDSSTATFTGVPPVCVAMPGLGQGERCYDATGEGQLGVCGDGLSCASSGVCEARLPAGSVCDYYDACVDGLFCGPTNTCIPLPGLGEACGDGIGCAEGLSCSSSYGSDGTCVGLPGYDDACLVDQGCTSGLFCDVGSDPFASGLGRCARLKAQGASCDNYQECESGNCSGGVCAGVFTWICAYASGYDND